MTLNSAARALLRVLTLILALTSLCGVADAQTFVTWSMINPPPSGFIAEGTIYYWNGTSYVPFAGNTSGTQPFCESASGVPSWGGCGGGGSGTVGSGTTNQIPYYASAGNAVTAVTVSGDLTFAAGVFTLDTVNTGPGSFGSGTSVPVITVNGKGLVTSSNSTTITHASNDLPLTGGTLTGKLNTVASATGGAGLNLAPGAAPTSPANGDLWLTSGGLFAQINGVTVGPFTGNTGTVTSIGTTAPITGGTITGSGTIGCATCGVTGSNLSQFASGGAINPASTGATTPGSVAATTLSASGAVNLTGLNTSGTIGGSLCETAPGIVLYIASANCFTSSASIAFPQGASGTINSGGVVYANSTSQISVSPAGTAGHLVTWGGAGTAPQDGGVVNGAALGGTAQTSPTGTSTSTTGIMLGLGSSWTLTPAKNGTVLIGFSGQIRLNTSASYFCQWNINFGTGTAPANGASNTGTATGGSQIASTLAASAANYPAGMTTLITGLNTGTAYWFDIKLATGTSGDACQLQNLSEFALEQ